jgi:hypothetical protein
MKGPSAVWASADKRTDLRTSARFGDRDADRLGQELVLLVGELAEVVGEHHVVEGARHVRLQVIDGRGPASRRAGCGPPSRLQARRRRPSGCCPGPPPQPTRPGPRSRPAPRREGPGWTGFPAIPGTGIMALDFFTADLLNDAKGYVLAVTENGTRR